jgi:hypothetical protein
MKTTKKTKKKTTTTKSPAPEPIVTFGDLLAAVDAALAGYNVRQVPSAFESMFGLGLIVGSGGKNTEMLPETLICARVMTQFGIKPRKYARKLSQVEKNMIAIMQEIRARLPEASIARPTIAPEQQSQSDASTMKSRR